jgi:hypothetical protein
LIREKLTVVGVPLMVVKTFVVNEVRPEVVLPLDEVADVGAGVEVGDKEVVCKMEGEDDDVGVPADDGEEEEGTELLLLGGSDVLVGEDVLDCGVLVEVTLVEWTRNAQHKANNTA